MARNNRFETLQHLFDDFKHMRQINRENLFAILKYNKDTAFGKRYDFSRIKSEHDYREAVPLTTYNDYEPFLGKAQGHTAYAIKTILATSGTTSGKQKEFPLTYEALARDSGHVFLMPYYLTGVYEGPFLHTSVFRSPQNGKTLLSAAHYDYLLEEGFLNPDAFVGGRELLYSDTIQDVAYLKAYLALSCEELVTLQSIFLYDLLSLFGYIEQFWRKILSDMREGIISGDMDEKSKQRLLKHRPDFERIDALEAELSKGFENGVAKRIWKNLRFAVGIGGGIYAFQEMELKRYLGDLPIYYSLFASSECMMALAFDMNKAEYALFPQNAYYEFLDENGELVPLEALEAGSVYELVLTTFSGLYRYRMGDKIRLTGFHDESPTFVAVGRTNHVLNIAGEKLGEMVAKQAVAECISELSLHANDFALGIDRSVLPHRYCLFVESQSFGTQAFARALDEKLRAACYDYNDLRNLNLISSPILACLAWGKIRETLAKTRKGPAHDKPKMFLNDAQTEALLKESLSV